MASSDGRSRSTDASTDSIELTPSTDAALTQTYEAASKAGLRQKAETAFEANVILIAHPENKLLGSRFRLSPGAVIEIGRSPAVEISLPEVLSISRNHARLEHVGSCVMVEDLGSTNGTYVNDQLIQEPGPVRSGDRFQVGAVHFKLLHEKDVEHAYHQAIYNLVMRDGLTEIFNKRKFSEEVTREFARARRYGRPLTLILFDLDHFKKLNDTYGHLCGDFVLKRVTQLAREALRTEQVFARVGGEEFVILSPETDIEGAAQLAEKLRETLAQCELEYAGFEISISSSFGVAAIAEWMQNADQLYDAPPIGRSICRRRPAAIESPSTPPRSAAKSPVPFERLASLGAVFSQDAGPSRVPPGGGAEPAGLARSGESVGVPEVRESSPWKPVSSAVISCFAAWGGEAWPRSGWRWTPSSIARSRSRPFSPASSTSLNSRSVSCARPRSWPSSSIRTSSRSTTSASRTINRFSCSRTSRAARSR